MKLIDRLNQGKKVITSGKLQKYYSTKIRKKEQLPMNNQEAADAFAEKIKNNNESKRIKNT